MGNDPLDRVDPSGNEGILGTIASGLEWADENIFTPLGPMGGVEEHMVEAPLVAGLRGLERGAEVATSTRRAEQVAVNAERGAAREAKRAEQLAAENPGAKVQNQSTLRDATGKAVKDPITNETRRVDHAVIKDGKATTHETTSQTANKTAQMSKEQRIRDNGGQYVRDRQTKQLCHVDGISQVTRCD